MTTPHLDLRIRQGISGEPRPRPLDQRRQAIKYLTGKLLGQPWPSGAVRGAGLSRAPDASPPRQARHGILVWRGKGD